jgi:hypothetical protein
MAKHLTNVRHRRAGAQQVASQRVSQPMRCDTLYPGATAGVAHDRPHSRGFEGTDRRVHRQEHARLAWTGAAAVEMRNQRLTDFGGQRKPVAAMAFAVDVNLRSRPVQVTELEAGDLDGSQSQSR